MSTRLEIAYDVAQFASSMLVYRPVEYSFDMEPTPVKNFTSILVDDLNMEVDETGRVISIWGLCSHTRWTKAPLTPPSARTGALLVVSDRPLLRGVSVRLNHLKYLPTYVDWGSGWFPSVASCRISRWRDVSGSTSPYHDSAASFGSMTLPLRVVRFCHQRPLEET